MLSKLSSASCYIPILLAHLYKLQKYILVNSKIMEKLHAGASAKNGLTLTDFLIDSSDYLSVDVMMVERTILEQNTKTKKYFTCTRNLRIT